MKPFSFALSCILFGIIPAFSQNLTMNKAETVVKFTIKNLGINVEGVFPDVAVTAAFDENNLKDSYFSGTVNVKSIDTGIEARNNSLQKESYFNVAKYPTIKLVSKQLIKKEGTAYEFKGELSIKGVTKSVSFPITIAATPDGVMVKGDFDINRRDFKVGKKSWILNDTVNISIVYSGS